MLSRCNRNRMTPRGSVEGCRALGAGDRTPQPANSQSTALYDRSFGRHREGLAWKKPVRPHRTASEFGGVLEWDEDVVGVR